MRITLKREVNDRMLQTHDLRQLDLLEKDDHIVDDLQNIRARRSFGNHLEWNLICIEK